MTNMKTNKPLPFHFTSKIPCGIIGGEYHNMDIPRTVPDSTYMGIRVVAGVECYHHKHHDGHHTLLPLSWEFVSATATTWASVVRLVKEWKTLELGNQ